jgi:hypothetical protein
MNSPFYEAPVLSVTKITNKGLGASIQKELKSYWGIVRSAEHEMGVQARLPAKRFH